MTWQEREAQAYAVYRLALRWFLIPVDWEIGKDGRVRALISRPASWTDDEVTALWEAFGKNPFPGPRDPEHVARVVTGRRIDAIMAERLPREYWSENPGLDEQDYWESLIGDEPPDGESDE